MAYLKMELIRCIHNLKPEHRGSVATIGNFDGVHIGHQAIIRRVVEQAKARQLPSVVMVFEPQPMEYFSVHAPGHDKKASDGELPAPSKSPARLMRFREKFLRLQEFGVDRILCLSFNQKFRQLSAAEFVEKVLIAGLDVQYLVVGDDFCFGNDRSGNFDYLQAVGKRKGFAVVDTGTISIDGERVSSSRIRKVLENSDFKLAEKLLGQPYSISGKVVHGKALGRAIGTPTANIALHRQKSPLRGVYIVTWDDAAGKHYNGVANIGTRPTVNGDGELLEVHLFDCNEDLYGRYAKVTFLQKLRDEEKFANIEELKQWIAKDISQAKSYFGIQV